MAFGTSSSDNTPSWLIPRKSRRKHRLPKGWRWREIGEWAQIGDFCCDPRVMPVKLTDSGWLMTAGCHPVRTKRPKLTARHPGVR